jgi:hypothetical protein
MNSELQSDWADFNAFLDGRLGCADGAESLEDALTEFRAYQCELADARAKIQEAKASRDRGESAELDIEQLVLEVTEELSANGIDESPGSNQQ